MNNKLIYLAGLLGLFLLFSGCSKEEAGQNNNLSFISLNPVAVPEASGLSEYSHGRYLTVSDSLSKVFVLSNTGTVLKSLEYTGNNLEGVTYDPFSGSIYVVEEKYGEVVKLDSTGMELDRFFIPVGNLDPRHGLEGICFNTANRHLYVISEMNPSVLFELDSSGIVIQSFELSFARDYSSICYEPQEGMLWILSEDSRTLTKTTLQGIAVITYNTGVKKGEGVVVDIKRSRVYIITDSTSTFFILSLS